MLIQLPRTLHTVLDFTLVPALLVSGLSLTAVVHLCTYFWIRPPFSLKRHLIVNIARVGLTIGDLSVFPGLGVVPQRDAREQTVLSNWYTKSPDTDVDVRIIEPLSKDVPRLEIIERVKGKVGEAPVPGFMVAPAGTALWARAAPGERVVLHLVGGGYVTGHPLETHGVFSLVDITRGRVFSANYRKSLDDATAFPASLLDSLAGWQFLVHELGFAPRNITLAGESAGGNAVLALTRYLDELEQHGYTALGLPAGMILAAPWSDMTCSFPSIKANKYTDYLMDLSVYAIPSHTRHYSNQLSDAYFSPALSMHGDDPHWKRLASARVAVHVSGGTAEALWDEIVALVQTMQAAGVDVAFAQLALGVHCDYLIKDFAVMQPDLAYTWPAVKQGWIEYFEALDKRGYN